MIVLPLRHGSEVNEYGFIRAGTCVGSNSLNKSNVLFRKEIAMESYIQSEEFRKKVAKVGPNSEFSYRSKFDPVPSSELKKSRPRNKKTE